MAHRRALKSVPRPGRSPAMAPVHPDSAGLDSHREFHFVAVPADRDPQPVRKLGAFTDDGHALADGLPKCGLRTVAMESTGVSGIPRYELLQKRGCVVVLVDPRQLKSVPGRQSDVADCQWLPQRHTEGLLAAAFRPDDWMSGGQTCVLRADLRQRGLLVEFAAEHIRHRQQALTQRNLKLEKVLSDITGVTGRSIIHAILAGARDPVKLARLRDERCHHDEATIARALTGEWRDEPLFAWRQSRDLYRSTQMLIAECDTQLEATLQTGTDREPLPPPDRQRPPAKPKPRGHKQGTPDFDAQRLLEQKVGVDLTRITGLDGHPAWKIIRETGTDLSRWPTEKHFASWLALCPDNRESAGRRHSGQTRPSSNRVAAALRLAAKARHHSQTARGAYLRRRKASLGAPTAITATARQLAVMIYRARKHGLEYVDPGQTWYEQQYHDRLRQSLTRRARELGYQLIPTPPTATA